MPKYIVRVKEVWDQGFEVEAENPNEAAEKVRDGCGHIVKDIFEYDRTIRYNEWDVKEIEDKPALMKDVHTEHCCKDCGCKYGEKDCPVVLGLKKQSFKCGDAYTCFDVGEW